MRKIYDFFSKLPKWYGICIIIIYSIVTAEYISTLSQFMLAQFEDVPQIVSLFFYFGYIAAILISVVIWIIYSYLFYLTALVLGGNGSFEKVLNTSAYTFILPSLCIFIAIILLDGIDTQKMEDFQEFYLKNERFKNINLFVDLAFVPYYILNVIIIHHALKINWWYSIISVFGPIIAMMGLSKLFQLI